MRLSIAGIFDRGVPNKERIGLTVAVEANLSFYGLLLTSYAPGGQTISAGSISAYWFPPGIVKPGDFVIIYTGAGTNTTEQRQGGGTNYFFHWGLPRTVFEKSEVCAVLFELASWATSR
jgi:hypothetical protein